MKKTALAIAIAATSLGLAACGNKTLSVGKYIIHQVKITSTSISDGDWKISGTTNAPDGAKIAAVSLSDKVSPNENVSENADVGWAKVHDGEFKANISGITAPKSTTPKKGQTTKVVVFAIEDYKKDTTDDLPSKVVKAAKDKFDTLTLTMNSKQVKYLKSLDDAFGDDDSDTTDLNSNSSSESSSSTSTTSTADLDQALADRLNEEKGYDAAWSKFVDNVTYDGDKITIELNASADALTDPELQVVARMSQGMALNVLNEKGEISDSKAGKGMPTFWTRDGHQVGYAAKRNYHLYFFK